MLTEYYNNNVLYHFERMQLPLSPQTMIKRMHQQIKKDRYEDLVDMCHQSIIPSVNQHFFFLRLTNKDNLIFLEY